MIQRLIIYHSPDPFRMVYALWTGETVLDAGSTKDPLRLTLCLAEGL